MMFLNDGIETFADSKNDGKCTQQKVGLNYDRKDIYDVAPVLYCFLKGFYTSKCITVNSCQRDWAQK